MNTIGQYYLTVETFNLMVLIWIGIALLLFPILLKVTAPYGRHSKTSWGLMINNRLGWIIMEIPSLLLVLYFVHRSANFSNLLMLTAGFLWVLHYFHRAVIFPFRIHTKGKKMPVLIMLFALIFNLVNGSINGYWLAHFVPDFTLSGMHLLRFIAGIALFVSGFVINQYHDHLLIRLRKSSVNGYKIPHGGLFNYISCPNFLGEIIEWAGFALLCWSLPSLAFLIWTMVNLVPRALDHHQWYRSHFTDYPQQRKAILPKLL
jgi:3-oxo-5-alpha-steroid 4-dehydrogenase 1